MSASRLNSYFGFTRTPFGRDLAPAMLHRHASFEQAAARTAWCVAERSIGVITGEVGVGKTAAVRSVLTTLDPSRHSVIYLPNPAVGVRGIHTTIVTALGGAPAHHTATLIPQATDALAAEHHERGKTPIIVLDEAHLLSHHQLEAVRMLTNHEMDSTSTTAVLLIGQPTLKRQMRLGVLAALEQRILLRYTMTGMTPAETAEYIRHHTGLAGRSDTLFSDDAAKLIHETGRGHPRAVNKLAITALTAAFAENKAIVDESSVRAAITELTTD